MIGGILDDSVFRNIPISHIKNLLDSFVIYKYEDIPVELHETAVHNITKFIELLDDADLISFVKDAMDRNITPKMEVKQPFREIAMYFRKRVMGFKQNNATN
jgi:esterase/lipase superfamily enzyme